MSIILRKYIDIIMYVIFLIMMGYHITGNNVHEVLGVIIFTLFIIHNILNYKWYKGVFKGKYNALKIINIALIIAFLITMVSGIMISKSTFYNLHIIKFQNARFIHLVSTSWVYLLLSSHLGLHLHKLMSKIDNKLSTLLTIIIIIIGVYSFLDVAYYKELFLLSEYKNVNYSQSSIIYYLKYLFISITFALSTYLFYYKIIIERSKKVLVNGKK